MRIVIDMQGVQTQSRFRGIGRYGLCLAQALVRNRGRHEVLLALNSLLPEAIDGIRAAFDGLLPCECIRVWYAPGPTRAADAGNDARRRRAEVIREAFLASLAPDVVHVTSVFEGFGDDAVTGAPASRGSWITSVSHHDLIPWHDPDRYLRPDPLRERWYRDRLDVLRHADLLLANSEFTARDAHRALALAEERVVCVSAACAPVFGPLALAGARAESLVRRLGLDRPFVLAAGTIEPHKNLARLFRAWARLRRDVRERHRLALIGRNDERHRRLLRDMARTAGVRDEELVLAHVSDDELVALYNLCAVTVLPSYDEGFGLPALEAMTCGAAVIGANAASIPEVIGREDALFDPYDDVAIAEKLEQVLTDEVLRASLKASGRERAGRFSWDATAKRAFAALERVAKRRDPGPTGERPRVGDVLSACIDAVAGIAPAPGERESLALAQALAYSFPPRDRVPRLFVDVSELEQRDARTGCQRVTRSVLLELLRNPPAGFRVEPVYATVDSFGYRYARRAIARLGGRSGGDEDAVPIDFCPGDVFFGLDYQAQVVPAQRDFLLLLKRLGIPCRFLVHDILPVLLPDYFPAGTEPGFRRWLCTLALFDGVVCVSQATANALRDWYRAHLPGFDPRFRIEWVHNGADIESSAPSAGLPAEAPTLLAQLDARPSFLMVGTIEPRKGHGQALAAFEALWAEGVDVGLVIVGKQGWHVEALIERLRGHPERNRRLYWLEGISDEYLEKLYDAADCLIAASEGEGFGLPLIEAARRGLPILARDIPVFREVAGDHAAYFAGREGTDLAATMKDWLAQYAAGRHPKPDAVPWISWRESTRRLLECVLAERAPSPRRGADERARPGGSVEAAAPAREEIHGGAQGA
ncbi:MAG TPA: glycosyltransferase family 1 protein [Burkholderiales bacterium]